MHNVDFKSDLYNLILYLKCDHVKYTDFSWILYLATFSVHCPVKSHVAIYVHRFQINTIFMHNVDFKSDL